MRSDNRVVHLISLALALLLAFPSATAFAGQEEARKYFKEAKQAYSEGEFERAAELLEKAYSEEANLTYQYNRIRALEGAGNYEEALDALETYERPMLDAKGFEDVKDLKISLQEKVEREPDPEGEQSTDDLRETKEDDESDSTATSDASDGTMRLLGWGLTGVGAASGLTAIGFGSTLFLSKEARDKLSNNEPVAPDSELGTEIRTHRTLTVVFGSVGAAALIGGGVILLTQSPEDGASDSTAELQPHVTPFVSDDGGGAAVHFRF